MGLFPVIVSIPMLLFPSRGEGANNNRGCERVHRSTTTATDEKDDRLVVSAKQRTANIPTADNHIVGIVQLSPFQVICLCVCVVRLPAAPIDSHVDVRLRRQSGTRHMVK
jgi:hypothetical protein